MRVFKNKGFARFTRKAGIDDAALLEAVERAVRGQIDGDLGGGVIKQRVARTGQGRSGGFRTIILFRFNHRAFFVHGFAKSEKDNIRTDELEAFRMLGVVLMNMDDAAIETAIAKGAFTELERS